jgi:glycosyltransferase involved in cell wall biosynthesis
MIRPTVDILVAFHRNDDFLQEALESIRNSKKITTRIILIDDRVSDVTLPPIQADELLLKTRGGEGFEAAINYGSKKLNSDYVAMLGSDDITDKNRLDCQIKQIQKDDAELSICRIQKFRATSHLPSLTGKILGNMYIKQVLLLAPVGADGTWVGKRAWWEKNILFNKIDNDWALALRIIHKTRIAYTTEATYFYRMHKNQITRSLDQISTQIERVYPEWIKYANQLGLPTLSMSQFTYLLSRDFLGEDECSRIQVLHWLRAYWQILNISERKGLREIYGRKLIFLGALTKLNGVSFAQYLLSVRAIPRLVLDLLRLFLVMAKGGWNDFRPRIWMDLRRL